MDQQDRAVIEVDDDVFGAPADGIDAPADEARREAFGKGEAQVRPALLHAKEAPPQKLQGKAAADGFDFG